MQTIQCVFTDSLIPAASLRFQKKYAYNVTQPVELNTLIKPLNVKSRLQIVEILPETWKYVNTKTKELRNEALSSSDVEIKLLELPTPAPSAD